MPSPTASAANWAHEEFFGADLADPRWRTRLVRVAAQAARRPGGKVTEVFTTSAERQGAYGLLESEAVKEPAVSAAMFEATAKRCTREEFVFCAVDGSSVALTDRGSAKGFGSIGAHSMGTRGLKVLNALALSPKGVPLGVSGQVFWARPPKKVKRHRRGRTTEEKEIRHWLEAMDQTREAVRAHAPGTRVWFQLDREADAWPILEQADAAGHWFTIRGHHDRRVVLPSGGKTYLRALVGSEPELSGYRLPVTAGPMRSPRTADMRIRACTVTLDFLDRRTGRHFCKTLNVVLAREEGTTPPAEKPLEWLLLTNRPIETDEQLHQIVVGYSFRWRIEEFHRTWKSGACRVEDSQLRTVSAAVKWATILAAVAIRIERIKLLSREEPERPATDEFNPIELRAITLLRFEKAAGKHYSAQIVPTIAQATLWLAQIGGYTGKSSGGPPGSATLARGLKEVATAVRAIEALAGSSD
jgi:transposase-like protein/transposase Tn5 family protein